MSALDPGAGLTDRTILAADGRTLRLVEAGAGGPVVVFEAGMSACASSWVTAQRLVAERTATASYDRAGHGGSDPDAGPRTLERMAEDLHAVVEVVSPSAPVVLVGHSWGGPVLRVYAEAHPERVAGLVFVDATACAVMDEKTAKRTPKLFALLATLQRVGLAAPLLRRTMSGHASPDVSAADRVVLERDFTSGRSMATAVLEARQILPGLPTMHRLESAGLPDVPVAAIVGGRVGTRDAEVRGAMVGCWQAEMAAHPRGTCVVVPGAGHLVPQEQPRASVDAILDVVARATAATEA